MAPLVEDADHLEVRGHLIERRPVVNRRSSGECLEVGEVPSLDPPPGSGELRVEKGRVRPDHELFLALGSQTAELHKGNPDPDDQGHAPQAGQDLQRVHKSSSGSRWRRAPAIPVAVVTSLTTSAPSALLPNGWTIKNVGPAGNSGAHGPADHAGAPLGDATLRYGAVSQSNTEPVNVEFDPPSVAIRSRPPSWAIPVTTRVHRVTLRVRSTRTLPTRWPA